MLSAEQVQGIKEYLEQPRIQEYLKNGKLKIIEPDTYERELTAAREEGRQSGYRIGLETGLSEPNPKEQLKTLKNRLKLAEYDVATLKWQIEQWDSALSQAAKS